ncbi:hypothetical protein T484DRAFT_1832186 [Baffinella frigidus]|nr:hypothetical protein T484DRAFT_1832186 [Cryptophyta sp. CCMP2293]
MRRAVHWARAPLTVLALAMTFQPSVSDDAADRAASGEPLREWRTSQRIREWREIHFLAGFSSPHAWVRDPENCSHPPPGAAYLPGCAHGYRYSATPPTSAAALCASLAAHNIQRVTMLGDSLMRNFFSAVVTLLRDPPPATSHQR